MIRKTVISLLGFALFLVGCATANPTPPPPTATPLPTAAELVTQGASRLQTLAGFSFTIAHSGPPAYLDPAGVIALREATGSYVAPDRAQALVTAATPGFVTQIEVISIAATQWQTNVLTGEWEELPPNWGFNPAALFDGELGLQSILVNDVSDLVLVGEETLNEVPLYHVTGTAVADNLFLLTGGLIGPAPVTVDLWVDSGSGDIHRIIVTEPAASADAEPSIWTVDFSNFGATVAIEPPLSE